MTGKILRLYPLPPEQLAGGIYDDLELPPAERFAPSRPYVIINMVSSVDGRTAIEGRAAGLGDEADRAVMRTLRSKADAVMVGAGTLRAERLSLGLDDPYQPLAVIVTSTGDVPLEKNLVSCKGQEVLVLTTQHAPEDLDYHTENPRIIRLPATPSGGVDLQEALETLKSTRGVGLLLVEGGPTLNHALISAGLVDELFLTLAPKLLGGSESPTIVGGPKLDATDLGLVSAHLAASELFLRYKRIIHTEIETPD